MLSLSLNGSETSQASLFQNDPLLKAPPAPRWKQREDKSQVSHTTPTDARPLLHLRGGCCLTFRHFNRNKSSHLTPLSSSSSSSYCVGKKCSVSLSALISHCHKLQSDMASLRLLHFMFVGFFIDPHFPIFRCWERFRPSAVNKPLWAISSLFSVFYPRNRNTQLYRKT